MKKAILLFPLLLFSCNEIPFPPGQHLSRIIAYVHWQDQGLAGKKIVLIETSDTLYTDPIGLSKFYVHAGRYTLRAFDINRGGPCCGSIDFKVEILPGEVKMVDIVDCLPCV
jgi:hypothetical protein